MSRQVFQQPELPNRSEYGSTLYAYGHRSNVNLQFAELNNLAIGRLRLGSQKIADSGDQLARAEGLSNIPVCAEVECVKPIRFLSLGGKKDYRCFGQLFVLADLSTQIEPTDARQHNIQKEKCGLRSRRLAYDRRTRKKCTDLIARRS